MLFIVLHPQNQDNLPDPAVNCYLRRKRGLFLKNEKCPSFLFPSRLLAAADRTAPVNYHKTKGSTPYFSERM